MENFCWPKRETEATEICGQRSKEMAQAVGWTVGGPSANGEGGNCKGQQGSGTVVQHERADCVWNRLQEGVAGGVG